MIIAPTNRYGIEKNIYRVQRELENSLPWIDTVGTDNVLIYGKVYGNDAPGGKRMESFVSVKDYVEGIVSNKTVCQIGFNVLSRGGNMSLRQAVIDIIFFANVNKLYANELFQTERALSDSHNALMAVGCVNSIPEIKEGLSSVFGGFDLSGLTYTDMAPYYLWALTYETTYTF